MFDYNLAALVSENKTLLQKSVRHNFQLGCEEIMYVQG